MLLVGVPQISEDTSIEQAADRLMRAFAGVPPNRIRDVLREVHEDFRGSAVRDYVPLLVERIAHSKLCAEAGEPQSAPCLPDHLAEPHQTRRRGRYPRG